MHLAQRGKNGVYYVRFQWQGKDIWRSTGLTNKKSAEAAAKVLVDTIKRDRIEALVKTKLKTPYPTLKSLMDLYEAGTSVRRATARNNTGALALMVRTVLHKKPDELRADVLTASLVRNYQAARLAAATNQVVKESAEISATQPSGPRAHCLPKRSDICTMG